MTETRQDKTCNTWLIKTACSLADQVRSGPCSADACAIDIEWTSAEKINLLPSSSHTHIDVLMETLRFGHQCLQGVTHKVSSGRTFKTHFFERPGGDTWDQ